MALNLKARATLDNRQYIASLREMGAATAGLSKGNIALAGKEAAASETMQARKQRAARAYVAQEIASTRSIARAQQESMKASAEATRIGLSSQRYLYADMARMTARAAAGLSVFPIAAAAAGIAWERDFANVVRTADPAFKRSQARVEELRLSLRDMVQTMPATWGDVTEIATLANQMGIASRETSAFTNSVAMFSATSGVSVDQTATAFGRLRSIVPDIRSDFMGLADSILKVGVNSVATESEIINIVTQISSIAGSAGFSSKEMIGLAGAMASVRVPPELSRGVVTRVFGQISRAVTDGGASLEGFAKISGMSAGDFSESWGKEGKSGRAFLAFVEGLRKLGPQAEAELRGLGITSVRDVPVMLRLANAADAEGQIGGLLRQTMGDAEDAAGETQRQYGIMADTVAAKLKVLANNVMAFFAEVGKTSLGPLGDIIDFVSNGIRDITNSLDDAARLGPLELGITNAELIGIVGTIGLATAGVLALGAAFLKVRQGMAGAQQLMSLIGGAGAGRAGGPGLIASQWTAFPGQVRTAMVAATSEVSRGSSRMIAAANRAGAGVTQALYGGGFGGRRGKFNPDVSGMVAMEARAQRTAAKVDAAFTKASESVTNAGRKMGAAAAFAFGPWGFAIGIGLAALTSWVEGTRAASTASSDLAEDLTSVRDVTKRIEKIQNLEIGGLFGYSSKPLKEGIGTLEEYREAALQTAKAENQLNEASTNRFVIAGRQAQVTGTELRATKEYGDALKVVNGAFTEMKGAGNAGAGLVSILSSAKDFDGLMDDLNSGKMKDVKRAFDAAFESENLKTSRGNLQKLAQGDLPEVMSAILGVGVAAGTTADQVMGIEDGAVAYTEMAKAADQVAASFINYADAVKVATDENNAFSMDNFSTELQKQMDAQNQWANNLGTAGRIGGSEFVNALLSMGTDAQQPLQAIIDNFNQTGGAADGAWRFWMDQIIQSTKTDMGSAQIAVAAARDEMARILQDSKLVDALARSTTPEQFQALSRGMQEVGTGFAREIANGVESGKYTVQEAIGRLAVEKELSINTNLNLDPATLSLQMFEAVANGTVTTVQLAALPTPAENALWTLVETANGQTGFVQVDAETGLATEKVAYVVNEAGQTTGVIPLTADDVQAISKVNGVQAKADGTIGTVKINGDASAAEAVLASLSSRVTYSTHVIQIMQQTFSDKAIKYGAQDGNRFMQANGGVMDFYANGGVRENHVAQIAPSGTMRVWAEPETGGEAYIPLAASKRARSVQILDQVASRFGYALQSQNYNKFADGGYYIAQAMSRRNNYIQPVVTTAGTEINLGGVNFMQSSQKDQFREFSRTIDRIRRSN